MSELTFSIRGMDMYEPCNIPGYRFGIDKPPEKNNGMEMIFGSMYVHTEVGDMRLLDWMEWERQYNERNKS